MIRSNFMDSQFRYSLLVGGLKMRKLLQFWSISSRRFVCHLQTFLDYFLCWRQDDSALSAPERSVVEGFAKQLRRSREAVLRGWEKVRLCKKVETKVKKQRTGLW